MIRFETHSYEENTLVKQVTWHHRNKENKNNKTIMCVAVCSSSNIKAESARPSNTPF